MDVLGNAKQAMERTRSLIYLLLVVCVTYFGAWLNAGSASWTNVIVNSYAADQKLAEAGALGSSYLPAGKRPSGEALRRELLLDPTPAERADTLNKSGVWSYKDIVLRKEAYEKKRIDQRYVQVPLLNVSIFIYDLTLIMGLAICGILTVMYFCMRREYANVCLAFGEAHRLQRMHFAFKYLSGLLILRHPSGASKLTRYASIPQLALVVPVVMLCYAFLDDYHSLDRTMYISRELAVPRIRYEGATVALACILAFLCYWKNRDVGTLWSTIDRRVKSIVEHDFMAMINAEEYCQV